MSRVLTAAFRHAEDKVPVFLAGSPDARTAAMAAVPARFTVIDAVALQAWTTAWAGRGRFRWDSDRRYLEDEENWFDMALWSGTVLCGLAIGHESRREADVLELTLLEGAPDDHPLKGNVRIYAV
jgi:hypothetical protein